MRRGPALLRILTPLGWFALGVAAVALLAAAQCLPV